MKNTQLVIGIGEMLWDILPNGKKPGGAPCNFVYHAQKQGAKALTLSAVGKDDNGKELLNFLKAKGISTELIQRNNKPTSTVNITLDEQGIPEYIIHENVAWDFIKFNEKLRQQIMRADIVCFGSLAQRSSESLHTIEETLKHCKADSLILFDINLRQNYYSKKIIEKSLALCNVLKLNEEELPIVSKLLNIDDINEELQVLELIKRYNLKLVAFTKGSDSSLLMTLSEKSYLLTPKVKVKDTVGAGDAFTAVMITGFAKGHSLENIHKQAVETAAFVCTQDGAMPTYNDKLENSER